jgi:hypothetical protein
MGVEDGMSRCAHPRAMGTSGDVLTNGTPRRVLHGDALGLGALPQSALLFVGEPQSHGHDRKVSV